MTTPAAPQSAPTTPAAPAPDGQQAPASGTPTPVPTPPPSAPAQPAAPAGQQPAQGTTPAEKTFTQADLDRIINDRLKQQEQSLTKKFGEVFGVTDPNATTDPAKLLEQAQQQATAAQQRADLADARSLAALAGVSKDHIDLFLKLVDLGPLKDVDRANTAAVSAAIQQQVDAALTAAPMFKGSALPAASGGDRQAAATGKRTYTRAELETMPADQLAAIADDLQDAAREGRIVG